MKLFLYFVLTFPSIYFCKNCNSQNYIDYFRAIAKAEQEILDSNYNGAIEKYRQTFSKYDFIFPKDAYISAQIASYLNADSLTFYFISRGVENGFPVKYLLKNPHLTKWYKSDSGKQFSQSIIDSLSSLYNKKINSDLKAKLVPLIKKDQNLRDKFTYFPSKRIWNIIFRPKYQSRLHRKWMEQAKDQSKIILELTKENGFPSYKTIGTDDEKLYEKFGTTLNSWYAIVILYHHEYTWQDFKEILPVELEKGNINPMQFAMLRDFATRHFIFTENYRDSAYADYEYFVRWYVNSKEDTDTIIKKSCFTRIKENISTINDKRGKIGLKPFKYDSYEQKMQMNYNNEFKKGENFDISKPFFDFLFGII